MSDERIVFETTRFRVVQTSRKRNDGETETWHIVRHPGAVVILPIIDENRICLIQNYRTAINETLIELPAGTLEPDEDPAVAASRELAEETGYISGTIELLHEFYPSPGILDEKMWLYVARELTEDKPMRDAGEQIENFLVTRDEARDLLKEGQIKDAKTIAGLLYYDMLERQ